MKRFAAAAAAAALLAAPVAAEKIRIGTEGAYPPFNYLTADGELAGFDVEIARALCEQMQADCEFVIQEWDGMIPALLSGKYDAIIASMSITEERKQKVDFSEKYYNTPPALAVSKDSDLASSADLAGKAIGAQTATTHSNYAEEKFADSEVRLYPTADEYKLDLESGRVDAVIDDIVVLSQWVNSPEGACCKILEPLVADPVINGEGAGIAIRKGEDALREKFNEAIRGIRASGKYAEINDKYFDFDVY